MTNQEIIAVVTAHENGEPIQERWRGARNWTDHLGCIRWDFLETCYRVKPREPREIYVQDHHIIGIAGGRVYATESSAKLYSHSASTIVKFREVL